MLLSSWSINSYHTAVHLCNYKLIEHVESQISKASVVGLEVLSPFSSPVLYNSTGEQAVMTGLTY